MCGEAVWSGRLQRVMVFRPTSLWAVVGLLLWCGWACSVAAQVSVVADESAVEPTVAAGGTQFHSGVRGRNKLLYQLERIEVRGNRTQTAVILGYVPFAPGDSLDPTDPALNQTRFELMGTGFFRDVRLSLERGREHGWVVLVIEVEERNTLVVERFVAGLSRVVQNSGDEADPPRPYAGLGVEERNLFGLGTALSLAGVASVNVGDGSLLQYGVDLRYNDPSFLGKPYDFGVRLFHNHAREFFGRGVLVPSDRCSTRVLEDEEEDCDPDIEGLRSVVIYDRTGFGLGTADEIGSNLRFSIQWLGEWIQVRNPRTLVACGQRGRGGDYCEPIDFRIEHGGSAVSSLELGLIIDTRDHPAIPSRGHRLLLESRLASRVIGSDYDFVRPSITYERYFPLPWHHVLELGFFGGVIFGDAPFFYHFYAADLSDLLPSRQLELNLDHRRAPNLLNTTIGEMDAEEVAARLYLEYQLPVKRGSGVIHGIDAYFRAGIFMLSRREDLRVAIPGYEGLARVPVDLSFDVGVVADTDYGLFKIGFSSFVGFLPDLGRTRP